MKKFTKNDSGFICINCGHIVKNLGYSSRNHCPRCLYSIHVDINPGDRANDCHGFLKPYAVEINSKKGYVILYKCQKCGFTSKNKAADDDDIVEIIKLSVHKR